MRPMVKQFWREDSGAIAPTFALSLFALVAVGGIAFDYARLAAMDSELQNAADQATLAAATQLDGLSGACQRASDRAVDLVTNQTRMANDSNASGASVTITGVTDCTFAAGEKVRFWQDKAKTTAATSDANARFVEVTVNARTAKYALTPVVGALSSGAIAATAMAGLGSAICKVPPVMICNPREGADPSFTIANYIGKGLRLVSVGGGNGSWVAGNFGYLQTGAGSNGVPGLQEALGWESAPGNCISPDGVDTKPGGNTPATDAINTRFDIYDNGACQTGGRCPPSINSVKDLVRPNNPSGPNMCRLQNAGWQEANPANKRYLPNEANALTPTTLTPDLMGHPRDMCHAADDDALNYCTGPIGTGAWDRDAYFRANYGWTSVQWKANLVTGTNPIPAGEVNTVTRYKVYQWEIDNRNTTVGGRTILPTSESVGGSMRRHDQPICAPLQTPSYGSGTIPGGSSVDRRRISVAVVNCATGDGGTPVNGTSTGVTVSKWIEVFLVEPSYNRGSDSVGSGAGAHARSGTSAGDVYVEVIGETLTGGNGATAGQVVRRDVPYLVE